MSSYRRGHYKPGRSHLERSQDQLQKMSRDGSRRRARSRAAEEQRAVTQGSEAASSQQGEKADPLGRGGMPILGNRPMRWWDGLQWTSPTGSGPKAC
jgi:hypothetical protein